MKTEILEPIICDVKTLFKVQSWGTPNNFFSGIKSAAVAIPRANSIKKILFASLAFQGIELPYRFTLTSCEIIYRNKHIYSVKMSGFNMSSINLPSGRPQLSEWSTDEPPETFLGIGDEITMSEEFENQCYFVAHRYANDLHIAWNVEANADIIENPQHYRGIQPHIVKLIPGEYS